jgi:hypothetical protein
MNPFILYNNILRTATVAADSTADGFDVANLYDWKGYTLWRSGSTATQYITITTGSAVTADVLAIYNHNLHTVGATITLQAYDITEPSDWADLADITPANDKIIVLTFTQESNTQFRLKIENATAAPEIGEMILCDKLELPFGPDAPYIPADIGIEAQAEISVKGHPLGVNVEYYPVEINPVFTNKFTRAFYEGDFWNFVLHARQLLPFVYAWDFTNCPAHVYYVRCKDTQRFNPTYANSVHVEFFTLNLIGVSE